MHVGRKPIPGAIDRVAVLHESVEDRQIQIPEFFKDLPDRGR